MSETSAMELGPQPIDHLLERCGLKNHDVVAADQSLAVTHKVVSKARRGRRLTARMQKKVLAACNTALRNRDLPAVELADLFNYIGP